MFPDKEPPDILLEKSCKKLERVILLFDCPRELNRFWKLFSRLVSVVEVAAEVAVEVAEEVEEELELEEFNDEIRLCKSDLILP